MTISIDDTAQADGDSTDLTSGTITVAGGRKALYAIIVLESDDSSKEVGDVSWNLPTPEAFTLVQSQNAVSHGLLRIEIWELLDPSDGTDDVTVTIESGNSQKFGFVVISMTDVLQTAPTENPDNNDSTNASSSNVTIVGTSGDLVVDCEGRNSNSQSLSVGGGQAEIVTNFDISGNHRMGCSSEAQDGSVEMDWTHAGGKEINHLGFNIQEELAAVDDVEFAATVAEKSDPSTFRPKLEVVGY